MVKDRGALCAKQCLSPGIFGARSEERGGWF